MNLDIEEFIQKFGDVSEEYVFYGGEVTLRYYDKEHAYYLLKEDGSEEKQDGVTQTCHIIDKSDALIPWGVKMMYEKALRTIPGTRSAGAVVMSEVELEAWLLGAKSAHKEKLEEAGKTGHIAHNWIETYIKLLIVGEMHLAKFLPRPDDPRAAQACVAALDWMDRHNVRWLQTEKKIYSRNHKYAGTMDGLCYCDSCNDLKCCPESFVDRFTIADWKTSNYLYLEYLLQTAAYQSAVIEENSVIDPHGPLVVDRWVIRLGKDDGEFEAWHLQWHNFVEDFGAFLATLDLTRRVRALKQRIQDRKDDLRAALKAEKDAQKAAKALLVVEERVLAKAEREQKRLEAATAKKEAILKSREDKKASKLSKAKPEDISLLELVLNRPPPEVCDRCGRNLTAMGPYSDFIHFRSDDPSVPCILDLDKL